MKSIRKIFLTLFIAVAGFTFFAPPQIAEAQVGVCDFIGPICEAIGIKTTNGADAEDIAIQFLESRIQFILGILFVGIVVLAVFIIISAGIKYIQSQGDESKIEEANKAIKNVFIGIAILIIGVVGVFVALIFFNALGIGTGDGDVDNCITACENAGQGTRTCEIICSGNPEAYGNSGSSRANGN